VSLFFFAPLVGILPPQVVFAPAVSLRNYSKPPLFSDPPASTIPPIEFGRSYAFICLTLIPLNLLALVYPFLVDSIESLLGSANSPSLLSTRTGMVFFTSLPISFITLRQVFLSVYVNAALLIAVPDRMFEPPWNISRSYPSPLLAFQRGQ